MFIFMGLFSFIFGSYNIEDSIKKLISANEIVVEDLSEKEYLKLLGKKSKIKKKYICHFPMIYYVNYNTSFNYSGMAGTFDLKGWNRDMDHFNKTFRENKRLKERHEDLMMQYEHSKQLYNNAKMKRNQIIADARKGNKLLPYFANPIGSPPKKPTLKLLKLPKVPKDKEEYTVYKKPMSGKLDSKFTLPVHITSFENFSNLNSSHTLNKEFKDSIKSIFESIMKLQLKYSKKKKLEETLEAKLNSPKKNLKFKFNGTEKDGRIPLFLNKKNHTEIKNRTVNSKAETLDKIVKNVCKSQIISNLENGTIGGPLKNIILKDTKVDITKCQYSIPTTFPLPLQFIDYNDGKKDKIGAIDFIGKKLISLK